MVAPVVGIVFQAPFVKEVLLPWLNNVPGCPALSEYRPKYTRVAEEVVSRYTSTELNVPPADAVV